MTLFSGLRAWLSRKESGPAATVPLAYFLRVKNIGDRMNPLVLGWAGPLATKWTVDQTRPHLLAIGSMTGQANDQSIVWGAGVMSPAIGRSALRAENILALRGKHSHAALRAAGIPVADVPLGDPGYLVSRIHRRRRPAAERYRLGVVPHYIDWNCDLVQSLRKDPAVLVLDVRKPEAAFFDDVLSCSVILSSSLHGLVIAESFGVPNAWVEFSGNVVGDGFKFRDWFSMARRPQAKPIVAVNGADIATAARDCGLHEMLIDAAALVAPLKALAKSGVADIPARGARRYTICRRAPVPVFVISFNRAACLVRSIRSYRRLSVPIDIVVHDNGSDDAETLDALRDLEREGATVIRRGRITRDEDLNNVDETIAAYFECWAEPSRYVVTDCDIELEDSSAKALAVFDELLDRFPQVACVGPMLKISDLPARYPLRRQAVKRHVEQFWHREPKWTETACGRVAYQPALIDTTFALHRAGERFCRLKEGIRVYHPFEARHLDWYLTGDQQASYRRTASAGISHWWTEAALHDDDSEPADDGTCFLVERAPAGELQVLMRPVADLLRAP